MTADVQTQARIYALWKRGLWVIDLLLTVGLMGGVMATGLAQSWRSWVVARIPSWPLQTAIYVGVLGVGLTIFSLPLDWFRSFTLEHRFGLSTQRLPQWLWEQFKQFTIGGALGLILVEGLVALIRLKPETWWLWAALFWMGWSVLLTRVAPIWLIPIFYKQRPLENTGLRQRLEALLNRCGTRVGGIFELDLSRTTRKANACLCGMGRTRRVLVSDTLLAAHPPEEVEVVLAHEVGHHRFHHLGILIFVSALATSFSCLLVDRTARFGLARFGLSGLADLAALPLIGLLFLAASLLLMPLLNGLSRRLEKQADQYALDQTDDPQAFIATMKRLAERNLAELDPPRWVEWLFYDHPSISKRIALAQGRLAGATGGAR